MSKSTRREELKRQWPKGCMPPDDYVAWHAWAEAQWLHGLKQGNCVNCGRYCFPQELNALGSCSDVADCRTFVKKHGKLQLVPLIGD
jgi:hypothetical protein